MVMGKRGVQSISEGGELEKLKGGCDSVWEKNSKERRGELGEFVDRIEQNSEKGTGEQKSMNDNEDGKTCW